MPFPPMMLARSALVGGLRFDVLTLNAGFDGGVSRGYRESVFGTLIPSVIGSASENIRWIETTGSGDDLSIALTTAGLGQDYFQTVIIDGGPFSNLTIHSVDMGYSSGTNSVWTLNNLGDFFTVAQDHTITFIGAQ